MDMYCRFIVRFKSFFIFSVYWSSTIADRWTIHLLFTQLSPRRTYPRGAVESNVSFCCSHLKFISHLQYSQYFPIRSPTCFGHGKNVNHKHNSIGKRMVEDTRAFSLSLSSIRCGYGKDMRNEKKKLHKNEKRCDNANINFISYQKEFKPNRTRCAHQSPVKRFCKHHRPCIHLSVVRPSKNGLNLCVCMSKEKCAEITRKI